MNFDLTKMLKSVVKSSTKSLLSTGLKNQVKGLIKRGMQKSPQDIEKEIQATLGYMTSHYKLDKEQRIIFRPSSVFMHEWLSNSPLMKDKLVKDEENGQAYYQGQLLTNQDKVEIIHAFIRATNAQSSALSSHFDNAVKLLTASSVVAVQFKEAFAGWTEGSPSVIETWMEQCFGTALSSDPVYARMLFRRWLVGTARRAMKPGEVLDGVLTLRGDTGIGKTAFFKQLMAPPFENRTGEIYANVKNPNKTVEALLGKTIACIDELSLLEHVNTTETLKSLLTMTAIDTRLAWAREVRRFKMRCGLGATTNKEKFIPDAAMSRRLWVIELNPSQRLNFDYLTAHKKALWQEACYLANKGETCILTPEEQKMVEEHNAKFMVAT